VASRAHRSLDDAVFGILTTQEIQKLKEEAHKKPLKKNKRTV